MMLVKGLLRRLNNDKDVNATEIVKVSLFRKERPAKVMKVKTGVKIGVHTAVLC